MYEFSPNSVVKICNYSTDLSKITFFQLMLNGQVGLMLRIGDLRTISIHTNINSNNINPHKYQFKQYQSTQISIQSISIHTNININPHKYQFKQYQSTQISIQTISIHTNINSNNINPHKYQFKHYQSTQYKQPKLLYWLKYHETSTHCSK